MKTIQEIIKELNHIEIEKEYFNRFPINVHNIKNTNMNIKTYLDLVSKNFQEFLDRLCKMKPLDIKDQTYILFAYKSIEEDLNTSISVGLINSKDFDTTDISDMTTYAYEFTKQEEALTFLVSDTKFTQQHLIDIVIDFLSEVSFFGYEQEELQENQTKLEQAVNELENNYDIKNSVSISIHEFFEQLGLPNLDDKYLEEDNKLRAINKAVIDYNQYCRNIELVKLKNYITKEKI